MLIGLCYNPINRAAILFMISLVPAKIRCSADVPPGTGDRILPAIAVAAEELGLPSFSLRTKNFLPRDGSILVFLGGLDQIEPAPKMSFPSASIGEYAFNNLGNHIRSRKPYPR